MRKIIAIFLICFLTFSFVGCSKACEDIELSKDTITFTKEGQSKGIKVTTDPKDTTDELEFESDDEDVATVDEDGLVRAEGPGETTIIVRCGDEVAYCEIICDFNSDSNDDRDVPDVPDIPDIPDVPDDPETTEDACDTCGGTKLCPECHGNYKCQECGGSGDCQRCDGEEKFTCRTCEGEPDECRVCGGDGIVTESDKNRGGGSSESLDYAGLEWGTACTECTDGKDCANCNGTGEEDCPDCNYGYCPECDGKKITCDECDKGKCPDCT